MNFHEQLGFLFTGVGFIILCCLSLFFAILTALIPIFIWQINNRMKQSVAELHRINASVNRLVALHTTLLASYGIYGSQSSQDNAPSTPAQAPSKAASQEAELQFWKAKQAKALAEYEQSKQ